MSLDGFDIAVIGGGIIGLSIARALAEKHARVAIVDASGETPPATNAAAGMLAPSFENGAGNPEALYQLSIRSLKTWPSFAAALEEETGLDIDYRADGILGVAFTEAQAAVLADSCAVLQQRGAAVALMTGEDARMMEPFLSERVSAAFYAEDDAQVDARKALVALRASVQKKAGHLLAARLVSAQVKNGRYALTLSDGRAIEALKLVIASGAAATAGVIEDLPPPPVYPVKGEALAVRSPEAAFRRVIRGPGAYLCPKAEGRVIIGATEIPNCDDKEIDDAAIIALREKAHALVPVAQSWPETERWSGLRPATPDKAPILGRDLRGPDGVYLALGSYRNGVLLAPASAEAVAGEVLGETPVIDLKPFRPDRFGNKQAPHHG